MEENPYPAGGAGVEPTIAGPQGSAAERADSGGVEPTQVRHRESGAEPTLVAGEPSVLSPSRPEGRAFGRYDLLEELGHGGMGRVWKAWDTELSRVVALKQILSEGPEDGDLVERFMREARLAAKLRHPHIVAVHDVGVHEGQHYFTADYIAGRTLDKVLAEGPVPLRQAAGWVRAVAEALSFAHEQGVIHRDVKPANLLIGEDGRPYVMDFGLAKEVETVTGLTASGDLMGTPSYMSPEQACGRTREVGPASDQFSLGATLYEVLSGRRPFEATDMRGLLNAVAEREPTPPSRINPRVHRDLEVICLKALEKDPSRRYGAMRDLAADLGRWLEGEPIHARPAGRCERLWRKTTRHRWVVLPSAAAVLLLLGTIAWVGLRAWDTAREVRAALSAAGRLEQEGDATTDPARREALWKEAQRTLQRVEAKDEGNVEASSSMARLAHRLDQLRAQQDLAARLATLDKAGLVDDVMVRFADLSEGVLWPMEAVYYDDRMETPEKRETIAPLWEEVERFMEETPGDAASQATMWACAGWARRIAGYDEEGLAWMKRAEGIDPEVPYGALLRAMAFFSMYADRQPLPGIAMGGSRGVAFGPAEPETTEMTGWRTEMELALESADGRLVWGRQEVRHYRAALEAMRAVQRGEYEQAAGAITRAMRRRELRPIRFGLLLARGRASYLAKAFDEALVDLEEMKTTRDGQARLWTDLALVRMGRAQVRCLRGEDPRGEFREAIDDYREALLREPLLLTAFVNRGIAYKGLGDAEHGRGQDPRASYGLAIADYDEALRRHPEDWSGYAGRGNAYRCLGEAEQARGGDPRASFLRALADFGEVLLRNVEWADAYCNRGIVHLRIGEAEQERGVDPRGSFQRAIADHEEALRRDPGSTDAHANRGIAYARLGDAEQARGVDPIGSFQSAIADYGEALRANPESVPTYNNRGLAFLRLGDEESKRGQDPRGTYGKAVADFEAALLRNPEFVEAFNGRGLASLYVGRAEQARGQDPSGRFHKAIADFGEALRRNPESAGAWLNRALVRMDLDQAQRARGHDSLETLPGAIADCGEVLRRNARHVEALYTRGDAYLELGGAESGRGKDPVGSYEAAIADYGEALKLNPELAGAYNGRGTGALRLGTWEQAQGRDASPRFRSAMADWDAALQRDPRYWEALANQGLCHEVMGEPAKAVECFERALAIVGDGYPDLQSWLARAREAAARTPGVEPPR